MQYKFLQIFQENFKKEDKIAILNHDNFYEIKQLKNFGYKIDTITLEKLMQDNMTSYDYIFIAYYGQTTNNLNSINDFKKENSELTCKKFVKYYKNKPEPMFEDCHFSASLIKKRDLNILKHTKNKKSK